MGMGKVAQRRWGIVQTEILNAEMDEGEGTGWGETKQQESGEERLQGDGKRERNKIEKGKEEGEKIYEGKEVAGIEYLGEEERVWG